MSMIFLISLGSQLPLDVLSVKICYVVKEIFTVM